MSADQHTDPARDQQEAARNNQDGSHNDDDYNNMLLGLLTQLCNEVSDQKDANNAMFGQLQEKLDNLEKNTLALNKSFNDLYVEVSAKLVAVQSTNEELKTKIDNLYRTIDNLSNSLSLASRRTDGVELAQSRLNTLISGIRNLIIDSGF